MPHNNPEGNRGSAIVVEGAQPPRPLWHFRGFPRVLCGIVPEGAVSIWLRPYKVNALGGKVVGLFVAKDLSNGVIG